MKFERKEFLELVEIAQPRIIYHTGRMHFFAYDGFVMYTFECQNSDFTQKLIGAMNSPTRHGANNSNNAFKF